jgi:hypothetical protein
LRKIRVEHLQSPTGRFPVVKRTSAISESEVSKCLTKVDVPGCKLPQKEYVLKVEKSLTLNRKENDKIMMKIKKNLASIKK